MNLHEFVSSPTGMTVANLVERLRGTKVGRRVSAVQLRQWVHGYDGRLPGAAYCVAIEAVTNGAVTRRDLRPTDWQDIWPELAESHANQPPALDGQALVAINSEAKEAAHV